MEREKMPLHSFDIRYIYNNSFATLTMNNA